MFESLEKGIQVGEEHNASYSEIRAEDMIITFIGYADGRIDNLNYRFRSGVACRVLCDGMWGFTCGRIENVSSLMERACGLARAAARHRKEQIMLQEIHPHEDETTKSCKIPIQDVPGEEKISRLDKLYAHIKKYDERIKAVTLKYTDSHGWKYLLTNEGTRIKQEMGHIYNYCWVTAKENGTLTAARDTVGTSEEGFEFFQKESEERISQRIANRVLLQLEGKSPRKGSYPCVLGPRVVGTLAHEALGHLAEADLTVNSSFHGKLGERIASDVTMVDAPVPGTFGMQKYDDEGVPMRGVNLIKDGIFSGMLTDREYAWRTGLPACGAARAESFLFPTLIRMRNTFFEAGDFTDEELFEGIDFGYYCVDYRGGQAELNSSFQVGIQEAFEIQKGEIGDPIKDLAISGLATEMLFTIQGVGKEIEFEDGYCGKGQTAAVSSGGPKMRVDEGGILFGGR